MTVNGICHASWDDVVIHVCGKPAEHGHMHVCACGAVLHMGTSTLTAEQRLHRSVDCPDCQARAGRPCVHRTAHGGTVVMPGVHATRAAAAKAAAH